MKMTVLAVGKLKDRWAKEGCDDYSARIQRVTPFEVIEDRTHKANWLQRFPRAQIWVLDSRGRQFSSQELAEKFAQLMNQSVAQVVFAIGGANGFSEPDLKSAHLCWSLGKMTLPHRMARLVVLEQIYRAWTIIRKEPYHHGGGE